MNSIRNSFFKACLAGFFLFLIACSKTENADFPDLKKDYYPLVPGHSITYQVDSIAYNKFDNSEIKFSFQIKDTVLTRIESGERTQTVYIERYKRENAGGKWAFQKVISRNITDLRAEEFIDNQRFVKMVFPPVKNVVWNGNTYNNLEKQDYFYKTLDQKDTLNALTFDSVAVVIQADEKNLLNEQYAEEHYSRNRGMIKKYVKNIEKDFYTQKTTHGYIYTMQILSFN
ncbi:hypothetical protein [Desertivirga arenae]|uniref:hypothetical protein n=1 Tax=Desertivirga arenae TaxID=2810309 RepID=UPI001A97885E|nr:hypothetical protein [Pedobacter sp. SYSU D00823]